MAPRERVPPRRLPAGVRARSGTRVAGPAATGPGLPAVVIVATVAFLVAFDRLPGAALAVVGVLAVADVLPERLPRWATAVTGAVVLALAVEPADGVPSGLLAGVLALGVAVALGGLRTTVGPGVGTLLVLGSALGVYLTVPDTEGILAVGAVLAPLTVVVLWPARTGWAGSFALAGLLAWAAADGARGRPGAVVGALACVALIAVPVVVVDRQIRAGAAPRVPTMRLWSVVVVQAVAVLICSRVAGLRTTAPAAAAIALPTLALAAGAQWLLLRHRRPARANP